MILNCPNYSYTGLNLGDSLCLDSGEHSDAENNATQGVGLKSPTVDASNMTCELASFETVLVPAEDLMVAHFERPHTKDCLLQCQGQEMKVLLGGSNDREIAIPSSHSSSTEQPKSELDVCNNSNTNSVKRLPSQQTSASTTTTSSSNISEEDLVENSALAEDVYVEFSHTLSTEKRPSIPEELKTTRQVFLRVGEPERFLIPVEYDAKEIETPILPQESGELMKDQLKSEGALSKQDVHDHNSRLSSSNSSEKHHSENRRRENLVSKEFSRFNSSKSTPSLNRRSLKSQQSSNTSQTGDQSSSYATAPSAPFLSSSSSNVEFPSTSIYETALSNLTQTLNNEQDLGHSNLTITDNNNMSSEMANLSVEDRQDVSSELYLSASNVGSPTITPNTEGSENIGGLSADEEENIAHQPPDIGSSPVACISKEATSREVSRDPKTQQCEENVPIESIDLDQTNRSFSVRRLSETNNRSNQSFTRKNSMQMVTEMPPLTEGQPIRYTSSHSSQNAESAPSSTSSGSLRQGKHLRDVSKRDSQDGGVSCSSSTSLERSPSKRRDSTVSQCSSVLSEGARNQLNFDLSPDLPLETSLLEANSVSPIDLERPNSPEPPSANSDQFDSRPESRLLNEDIICSLSSPIVDFSAGRMLESLEVETSPHVCAPISSCANKIKESASIDEKLDQKFEETDSIIFEDTADRQGTSSASSFCNDTVIENLPTSIRDLSAPLPPKQGRKSASPRSRIARAISIGSRSSSVNENRTSFSGKVAPSRIPEAHNRTSHISVRSKTSNSPSNTSNNNLNKLRSSNSSCSSSSSSHSSSRGSPKPQARGDHKNGKS